MNGDLSCGWVVVLRLMFTPTSTAYTDSTCSMIAAFMHESRLYLRKDVVKRTVGVYGAFLALRVPRILYLASIAVPRLNVVEELLAS